ncbi:MAG: signal peptidase II [Bacilli bacterium]|nr:signal peptidase II [Bacilli bacterium]
MSKMKVTWTKSLIIGLVVAGVLVGVDFLSKWLVQSLVPLASPIEVIPNFFYITKSYNTAVAFSIGSGWGVWGRVLNITISVVMSFAIFFYYLTHESKMKPVEKIIAVLLGAGAVGNLIDRAFYWSGTTGFDGVIDFFQFYLGGGPGAPSGFFNPFATFNFADACLTIGILMLLVVLVIDLIRDGKNDSNTEDPRLQSAPSTLAKENVEENKQVDEIPAQKEEKKDE